MSAVDLGSVIDGVYRVDRVIGKGGFGVVYECEDLTLGRPVALKMLDPQLADERELKRFVNEGRNLASLNHPNVVQIYRFGTHDERPYLVMELVRGKPMREVAHREGRTMRRTLELMRQIADGVQAIHAMGILHRDLSPNNVLVNESGTVKILDLGLSKDMNRLGTIETGNVLYGTLPYVSPEQIEGKGSTVASEVFSFGVMLYEALTDVHPFRAEHPMSLLFNIAHREPDPIQDHLAACPASLATLVERCLMKHPGERPASMAEVHRALGEILERETLDGAAGGAGVPSHSTAITAPLATSTARNPYLNRVMIKHRQDFFGRGLELKRISARLNASPPGSISIVGDRRIGKSSLLNYFYNRQNRAQLLEEPERTVMIFLDLQGEKGMTVESFVRVLIEIANYELRGRIDVSDCSLDLDGIKAMVQRLHGAGYRIAILLDEFEGVTTNPNFSLEFFSFLRFLANHYDIAYITSSARDLQVLCHTKEISDSPFFNIFSTMRLSVFQPHEAAELVRTPSARVGRPLEPYTTPILEMSGLFPFFIQMACAHTLEWIDEHPEAAAPDFAEIRARFATEATLHYRYIWDGFDPHERSTVLRVASGKNLPDALKHVLGELETRRYVEANQGKPRLFAAPFADFVRNVGGREAKPGLLSRLFGGG
jgi:serine/threonine protein kinase